MAEILSIIQKTRICQEQWQQQHKKLKAIDTLSDRHDARERYREGKQEQKQLDEFSSRKAATSRQE